MARKTSPATDRDVRPGFGFQCHGADNQGAFYNCARIALNNLISLLTPGPLYEILPLSRVDGRIHFMFHDDEDSSSRKEWSTLRLFNLTRNFTNKGGILSER